MDKFLKILGDAKYVIATIALITTSLIGGVKLMSDYFVTKAFADNLTNDVQSQIQQLKSLNKSNTIMIIQLRLLRFEQKMESGNELTPSEKREYKILTKKLEKLSLDK